MIVGASGNKAALVGALPNAADTENEVQAFVETLLEHDRIDFGKAEKKRAVDLESEVNWKTHTIKTVGGKKVLRRLRFLCGNCRSAL